MFVWYRHAGIEDGKETDEFETIPISFWVIALELLIGDSKSAKTTRSELLNVSLQRVLQFLTVGYLSVLVDGVERLEVQKLNTGTVSRTELVQCGEHG